MSEHISFHTWQTRAEKAERAGVVAFEAQLVAERERDDALATVEQLGIIGLKVERDRDEARATIERVKALVETWIDDGEWFYPDKLESALEGEKNEV